MDAREVTLTIDFCLRVGELLLSSGAGAPDVTATMRSLARHLGLRTAEIDVTFVNLSMQYQSDPSELPVLLTRQVKARTIDYEHLTRVDHLIRDVLRDKVDLREARAELGRIVSGGHGRPRWAATVGFAVMAAAVTVQLGGGVPVALLAFVSAAAIDRLQLVMARRQLPVFYQQAAGAGLASLLAVAAAAPTEVDVSSSITANIIVLLAGISFMGALQDALTGFYITAAARLLEALVSTAGIIAGVSGGLALAAVLGVGIHDVVPGATSLQTVGLTVAGAALAAAAFAYASYAPRRILVPVALVAAAAMAVVEAVPDSFDRSWKVAIAAFLVGLVSYPVAGRLRVPPLVVVVSAVVPLLPGLSIYRGLTLLARESEASSSAGLLAMFTAATVAVGLASGVLLGEYVAQPLSRTSRRLEARLAGPRLIGPVKVPTGRERRLRRRRAAAAARRDRPVARRARRGAEPVRRDR